MRKGHWAASLWAALCGGIVGKKSIKGAGVVPWGTWSCMKPPVSMLSGSQRAFRQLMIKDTHTIELTQKEIKTMQTEEEANI